MSQSIALDGITEGGHHVILTQYVVEGPGAVFTGEDLVAHAGSKVGRSGIGSRRLELSAENVREIGGLSVLQFKDFQDVKKTVVEMLGIAVGGVLKGP